MSVRRSSEVPSSKDRGCKTDISSVVGPSKSKTEEQGKKSRMNLPLLFVLWCGSAPLCCVVLCCVQALVSGLLRLSIC